MWDNYDEGYYESEYYDEGPDEEPYEYYYDDDEIIEPDFEEDCDLN